MPKDTIKVTPAQKAFVESVGNPQENAARNPGRVLKTFYPSNIDLSGVKVSKCGAGILGILEKIKHPFIEGAINNKEVTVSIADIQTALYIFAEPRAAKAAIATGKLEERVSDWIFDEEVPASAIVKAPAVLLNMIQENMNMVPGFDPESASTETGASGNPSEEPQPEAQA